VSAFVGLLLVIAGLALQSRTLSFTNCKYLEYFDPVALIP
jgi:hypothetical protein